jgi:hypothetical protein
MVLFGRIRSPWLIISFPVLAMLYSRLEMHWSGFGVGRHERQGIITEREIVERRP